VEVMHGVVIVGIAGGVVVLVVGEELGAEESDGSGGGQIMAPWSW
jgi:hypothetical protein